MLQESRHTSCCLQQNSEYLEMLISIVILVCSVGNPLSGSPIPTLLAIATDWSSQSDSHTGVIS